MIINCQLSNGKALYQTTEHCTACGACGAVCPQQAISLQEDHYGFLVPSVDQELCVGCELCIDICPTYKTPYFEPKNCYAGVNKDAEQLKRSSSGGIFSAIAAAFLANGGIVCGAAMTIVDNQADVRHIAISKVEELPALQGSKYVHSDASRCYKEIQSHLQAGTRVLFSGTPCQVAAVKSLFAQYAEQLFTIDLICHGVPSVAIFNAYLKTMAEKEKKSFTSICFRDKKFDWEASQGSAVMVDSEHRTKEKLFHKKDSSFYRFFSKSYILRDSCYNCPYARMERVGDLTLGDFWGIRQNAPELLVENHGPLTAQAGISCVLQNTEQGERLLNMAMSNMTLLPVQYEQILPRNPHFTEPPKTSNRRQLLLNAFRTEGYAEMDRLHQRWRDEERRKYCADTGVDLKELLPDESVL